MVGSQSSGKSSVLEALVRVLPGGGEDGRKPVGAGLADLGGGGPGLDPRNGCSRSYAVGRQALREPDTT